VPQIAIPAERADVRAAERADRRRGFWGNLFKKRK
jgi:hypothetical protein